MFRVCKSLGWLTASLQNGEAMPSSSSSSTPFSACSASLVPVWKSGRCMSARARAAPSSPPATEPALAITTFCSSFARSGSSCWRQSAALLHIATALAWNSAAGPPAICTSCPQRRAASLRLSPAPSNCRTSQLVAAPLSQWIASSDLSAASSSARAFTTTASLCS